MFFDVHTYVALVLDIMIYVYSFSRDASLSLDRSIAAESSVLRENENEN